MDRRVFDELRAIVYQSCGISLADSKMALVHARVNKRLRSLRLPSHKDYLKYLKEDKTGAEMISFLDVISTNTTYFFREPSHFSFLADCLDRWSAKGQRRFRIWCAASSSGEEPYSLAMAGVKATPQGTDLKILATDISTQILNEAKAGKYSSEKMEKVPKYLLHQFFHKSKNEHDQVFFTASSELKSMVLFKRLNLSKPPFPMTGPLDMVFCRNVMIYFDNPVRARLVQDIHRLLKPGGFLVIGHSESLTNISTPFKVLRPSIYQKT